MPIVRPPALSGSSISVWAPTARSWVASMPTSGLSAWMIRGRPSRSTLRRAGDSAASIVGRAADAVATDHS